MSVSETERIIILVDMDCFYCQVEEGLNPKLKGKPIAVVQYNQWQGGGIIAVNYPARDQGVTRHMRGGEAMEKCPRIELVSVPTKRGKADTSRYRNAGKRVAEVLLTFTSSLERASVDEAYLDITEQVHERINTASARLTQHQLPNTHVVGFDSIENFLEEVYDTELSNDLMLRLAIGAAMAEQIRTAVFEKTGYRCSAGIAHNKILAKLVCGLHKPNQQTVLPQDGVTELYEKMPVRKIQSLGGKFGTNVTDSLKIEYMGELIKFSEKELSQHFDYKTSQWLYQLARGIENTPVMVRLRSQSIGCCKKFPGPTALTCMAALRPWVEDLVAELHERLAEDRAEYRRRARHLVVNVSYVPPQVLREKKKVARRDEITQSRSMPMTADWDTGDGARTTDEFFTILTKSGVLPAVITDDESEVFSVRFLGLSAGKFENTQASIASFFKTIDGNKSLEGSAGTQASIASFFKTIDGNKSLEGSAGLEKSLDNIKSLENNIVLQEENVANIAKVGAAISFVNSITANQEDQNTNIPSFSKSRKSNSKKIGQTPKAANSFFRSYFQNVEQESSASSNDKMFATTSRTSNSPFNLNIAQESNKGAKEEQPSQLTDNSLKTICSECNKPVALEDVQSHSDYHFAIKLVREESHIYKNVIPTQNPVSKNAETIKKKAVKRKSSETMNCKSIESFFVGKKEKLDQSNGSDIRRQCVDCEKFIAESDFELHKDFHVAKKLACELNGNIAKIAKGKCDTRSVSTYFKAQ